MADRLTLGRLVRSIRSGSTVGSGGPTPPPPPTRTAPSGAIWVSTAGSDTTGTGSQASPYRSIAKGVSVATAGKTVWVLPGTYVENDSTAASVQITASGTASNPIFVMSSTVYGALIRPAASVEAGVRIDGQYVTLDGFDISEAGTSAQWSIPVYVHASNTTVQNNYVHDVAVNRTPSGSMILGYPYTLTNVTIDSNVVVRMGQNAMSSLYHGIYAGGPNWKITNNLVAKIVGLGVHCWHGANAITIANNTVINCLNSGILVGAGDAGAVPGGISNSKIVNNICRDNGRYGIMESGTVGTGNVYANNCLFGNGSGAYSVTSATPTGTVLSGPSFVTYATDGSGNYRLQDSSPCRNAGSPTYAPAFDLDGVARPQGTQVDIGCYERD